MSAAKIEGSDSKDIVVKPFVYGSVAIWQGKTSEEQKTHKWSVYLRGLDNEDLSYFIKKVVFTLHQSFNEPARSTSQHHLCIPHNPHTTIPHCISDTDVLCVCSCGGWWIV